VDAILTAAATALATRVGGALADGGLKALDSLRKAVHQAFDRHPAYQKALASAEATPNDMQRIKALAKALSMAAAQDADLKTALETLTPQIVVHQTNQQATIAAHATATNGGVTVQNIFGSVGGNATVTGSSPGEVQ
jgi:hypothetical protein